MAPRSRVSGRPDLVRTAIALAFRGLFVFPVVGKVPATERGFRDAVTALNEDADTVRELFARHPAATGIGVDCGRSGLLVVDLDGPQGEETWGRLLLEHGVVETLEVATGRPDGGRHLWFATNDIRSRNSTKKIGVGIDTRGQGGYVIAPPSTHPSGARYKWLPGSRPGAPSPIAAAPTWLLETLAPAAAAPVGQRRALAPGERLTPYGRVALNGLADQMLGAGEGSRNDTLLACARRAGRLEAAGEIDPELARVVLVQAAQAAGLDLVEADRTFENGFAFGQQYPARRSQ